MESYAMGEAEPALLEETIGANFERTVAAFPDREALVEFATGKRWTWRELDHDVDRVARGLIAAGIEKGDRVGIWGPTARVGRSRSTPRPRPGRSWSTSTRRTAPTSSPTR
jgi:fatty-acyl-CoA synthase